jgi:hypothetical protein
MQALLRKFSSEGLTHLNKNNIEELQENLSAQYTEVVKALKEFKGNRWNPQEMHYRDNMSLAKLRRFDKKLNEKEDEFYSKLQEINSKHDLLRKKLEFDKIFATKVLNYSVTELQIGDDIAEFLLVPDSLPSSKYYCSIQMLSTGASAGAAVLLKEVGFQGYYLGPTGREIAIKIISTKACTIEILGSFRLNPEYSNSNSAVLPRGNGGERRKQQLRPD